jgi:hypothetical protein
VHRKNKKVLYGDTNIRTHEGLKNFSGISARQCQRTLPTVGPEKLAAEPCSGACHEAIELYFSTPPERWRAPRAS